MMNRGINKTKASHTACAASLIISNKMNKTLNDATIPLRVPSSLKDALQILAEKQDRSLSNFIKLELEKIVTALATPAVIVTTSKPKAKPKAIAKPKAKK